MLDLFAHFVHFSCVSSIGHVKVALKLQGSSYCSSSNENLILRVFYLTQMWIQSHIHSYVQQTLIVNLLYILTLLQYIVGDFKVNSVQFLPSGCSNIEEWALTGTFQDPKEHLECFPSNE